MKKVKSEKALAEATRKQPRNGKAPASAGKAGGAMRSAAPKREAIRAKASKPVRRRPAKAAATGKRTAKGVTKKPGKKGAAPAPLPPVFQIRELDPVRICGDRTSVVQLFRVDEQAMAVGRAAGARQVHLVFNDRHGWYCEHGRSCHAVSAVMRHAGIR